MKKTRFLLCLLLVSAMFLLVSCDENKTEAPKEETPVVQPTVETPEPTPTPETPEPVKYTVTFETNGGSKISAVEVLENSGITEPESPTKDGHDFGGWYLDTELTQAVNFETLKVTANTTLYAKWDVRSYTVSFNTMGGSEIAEATVEYGKAVTIPANPTKEGYDFAGWYLKKDYSKPYANDLIKANTTLYAKWRSALRYAGTFEGEGKYEADGTYTFTVQLQMWGRVRIVYNGELLSMDDEDLTVTGAFVSENQAPWTPELYCDVPDEFSTEVDWTTLINSCSNPVNYTFTYDPKDHSLDIAAEEILPAKPDVPTEGLYVELYDNSKAFVDGYTLDADATAITVTMKQWWRIRVYYNGQPISATVATITGDFDDYNPNNKSLYIDLEWETEYDILCDYASEGVPYEISYDAETNTLNIQDDEEDPVVVIPTEGLCFEYTAPDTTLMAPQTVEANEDGSYTIVLDLAAWRYVVLHYNGELLDSADENLDVTLSGGFYIDDTGNPSSRFYVNALGTYQIVYTPATEEAKASLVAGKYVEPEVPGEDFVFTVANDQYAVVYTETGAVVDVQALWRLYLVVDAEGKIAYMCEMPKNGYGGFDSDTYVRHSDYADYTANPALGENKTVVLPEGWVALEAYTGNADVQALLKEITGLPYVEHGINTNTINVDKVRLTYDAAAGTFTVTEAEEETPVDPEPTEKEWLVSSDQYAVVFTEAGAEIEHKTKYRLYVVVDAEGRIAYMCDMPISGYGNASSTTYVRHSAYADYTLNPAFTNLGTEPIDQWGNIAYTLVVPQGGFALEVYTGEAAGQELVKLITGVAEYAECAINTNAVNVDDVRLAYADGKVTITEAEEETPVEPEPTEVVVTYGGTLAGTATLDEATGNYEVVVDLATWNNVILYVNGEAVSPSNLTVTGLYCSEPGADWTEKLYWEAADPTKLYTCTGGKYVLSYNHAAATLNISLYSVTYGGTYTGEATLNKESGNYEMVLDFKAWNRVVIYLNGKAVNPSELTVTGLYCSEPGADWTENLYWEEADPTLLLTCTGGKYVLLFNPEAKTLDISLYVEPAEPSDFEWATSSDEYTKMVTEAGTVVDVKGLWRLYIIVDAEGKIAYMCEMPKNGYGAIDSDTYVRHSDYADYTLNPAYVDGAFVVPEGGFAISEAYSGNTSVQQLMAAITGVETYAEHAINTNTINVDSIRVSYNAETGLVTVSTVKEEVVEPEQPVVQLIDPVFEEENGAVVLKGFVDAEGNAVELDSALYTYDYSKDEVSQGTTVPTEPGTYALAVTLADDANYEFITLNREDLKKHIWKVFTIAAPTVEGTIKVDPVFAEENGAIVLKGFVDAEGNAVELDSSLYTFDYSKDEVSQGTAVPTEPGTYALAVTLKDDANYEFITLNNPNLKKHVWKVFTVSAPAEE